jgi:hypothetical protein
LADRPAERVVGRPCDEHLGVEQRRRSGVESGPARGTPSSCDLSGAAIVAEPEQ